MRRASDTAGCIGGRGDAAPVTPSRVERRPRSLNFGKRVLDRTSTHVRDSPRGRGLACDGPFVGSRRGRASTSTPWRCARGVSPSKTTNSRRFGSLHPPSVAHRRVKQRRTSRAGGRAEASMTAWSPQASWVRTPRANSALRRDPPLQAIGVKEAVWSPRASLIAAVSVASGVEVTLASQGAGSSSLFGAW
jgi:hypothetical protein